MSDSTVRNADAMAREEVARKVLADHANWVVITDQDRKDLRVPVWAAIDAMLAFATLATLSPADGATGVEGLPEVPSDAVIRAVDKALHQHWPNARKMAVAMYGVIREAALTPTETEEQGKNKALSAIDEGRGGRDG